MYGEVIRPQLKVPLRLLHISTKPPRNQREPGELARHLSSNWICDYVPVLSIKAQRWGLGGHCSADFLLEKLREGEG